MGVGVKGRGSLPTTADGGWEGSGWEMARVAGTTHCYCDTCGILGTHREGQDGEAGAISFMP